MSSGAFSCHAPPERPLEKAALRAKNLQAVNPRLDFGNGRSLATYTLLIQSLQDKLDAYNEMITTLNLTLKGIELAEEELNDFSEHMLLGIATSYGKGSNEYAIAGGTRKQSQRYTSRPSTLMSIQSSFSQPIVAP
jgi:hypothetical protein